MIKVFTILSAALLAVSPFGAGTALSQPNSERPRIGLVLSGGGARGAAHIGVLEVLEELRVPVDCVAGTSFGAIVGGLYAAGLSPDDLRRAVSDLDWDTTLSNEAPRTVQTFRRKQDDDNFLVPFRLGVKDGKIKTPPGIILSGNFRQSIRDFVPNAQPDLDFDTLPIPFRAVAADLATGAEVVLKRGDLANAIVASMSVPGLFPASQFNGRLLVDGGIANNVPISVARGMCAEVVIVVDISEPPSETPGSNFGSVLGQMVSIMTYRNASAQLATVDTARGDVLIRPDVAQFGFADFKKASEIVPSGAQAAKAVSNALRAHALTPMEWSAHMRKRRGRSVAPSQLIAKITIKNDSQLDNRIVADQLGISEGDVLDRGALKAGTQRIYGLDYFDQVDYELAETGNGDVELIIDARERSWGPDNIRFGISLEDNFEGDAAYRLAVSYTKLGLNALGGEWRTSAQVGSVLSLSTEIFQPLDYEQVYFARLGLGVERETVPLRVEDQAIAEFTDVTLGAQFEVGRHFGNWGRATVGGQYTWSDIGLKTGVPFFEPDDGSDHNLTLFSSFEVDTFDNLDFPTRGLILGAFYAIDAEDGIDPDGGFFDIQFAKAQSWGSNHLVVTGEFATNFSNDDLVQNAFSLGGFTSMSGYANDSLAGSHLTQAGLIYYRRLSESRSPILDFPIYVGMTAEAGNVWRDLDDFALDNLIYGGSVFVGVESPLGPVYLGGGYNTDNLGALFLFIGNTF